MTIKQQGGIFGRNPTFNDVEVDGTLTLEGGLSTNSALTVNAATSTIESTGGAQLYLSRDDTAVANNNLIGGLAFKANDSSASPDPQYCGMKAYAAGSGNNPVLEFYSGNGNYDARTPQLSINYLGNVTIANGNLIMGTSGNGIDFSATSDGSGTATSELLDDYEEGTWTPSLGGDTTYTVQEGYYVKVGSLVNVKATILVNAIGTGSVNTISGLPYTNGGGIAACNVAYWGTIATAVNHLVGTVTADGTTIVMRGVTTAASTVSTITTFQNSTYVELTATYSTLT